MALVARLSRRLDTRVLVATGMLVAAMATWIMSWYTLDIDPRWVVWPSVLQGLGMGAVFVPLSATAYGTLRADQADAGAGLFNLARTVGSAVGVSVAATCYTRYSQIDWNRLGGHLTPYSAALRHWLAVHGLALGDPMAPMLLSRELARQASMMAFTQVFQLIALSFLIMAPLLLLLRRGERASG
jgi:DHA2 family multidrug resistance protein